MTRKRFTNRLIEETSPYLLQHAHNPVNWYPWGEEALEKARHEEKPILLSIGYSACHWCHVMERESFENEEIARLMNENFVCIKVDREERPDLDAIYMNAVQMMTGHGGWPMTVFLTPDIKPFYGGTYYPPEDRPGTPGFPRVLAAVAEAYKNRPEEVIHSAESIAGELGKMNRVQPSVEMLTPEILDQAYMALKGNFDGPNGGFGTAPKFPPSMSLMFLLRYYKRTKRPVALQMTEMTLDQMANGGMYDHLGGGFHRYSVDAKWLVPHFEKMLYDNALLARVYLYAYQTTKRLEYRMVAEEILRYVAREMTDPSGGFYSSEDADSEGEEGKFYTWTPEEVGEVLGPEEGRLFCDTFDVTEQGNFEPGRSILNLPRPLKDVARERGLAPSTLHEIVERGRERLLRAREARVRPGRDDKVLTAWNGLMLTAFAEGANILGRDDYRAVAVKNAEFVLKNLLRDGRLLRTYRGGRAKLNGYLEDYAYVMEGLLALYEATFELKYFERARALADTMMAHFGDESGTGFFFTSADHEDLITRTKDYFDHAIPSGNSAAALGLLKLWLLTDENRYRQHALAILRAMHQGMALHPTAFGYLLCALDLYLSEPQEIAIIGRVGSPEVRSFVQEIFARFLPNKVLALAEPDDPRPASSVALLKGKRAVDSAATVFVCRHYTCQAPATSVQELAGQLEG